MEAPKGAPKGFMKGSFRKAAQGFFNALCVGSSGACPRAVADDLQRQEGKGQIKPRRSCRGTPVPGKRHAARRKGAGSEAMERGKGEHKGKAGIFNAGAILLVPQGQAIS